MPSRHAGSTDLLPTLPNKYAGSKPRGPRRNPLGQGTVALERVIGLGIVLRLWIAADFAAIQDGQDRTVEQIIEFQRRTNERGAQMRTLLTLAMTLLFVLPGVGQPHPAAGNVRDRLIGGM